MFTNFKHEAPSATVQRRLRKLERDTAEERAKARVRRRDKGCRFPLCGCRRLRLPLEVSHNEHKGAGGNPAGDRSDDRLLMQLCRERHRTNPISIHSRGAQWAPILRSEGANGPVVWYLDVSLIHYLLGHSVRRPASVRLVEVARERMIGQPEVAPAYADLFVALATMAI